MSYSLERINYVLNVDGCNSGIYALTTTQTPHSCATAAECNDNDAVRDPVFGDIQATGICTNGNCDPDYWSVGCDLSAPRITIGDSAGGAALPAQWFTSKNQLERYLESTVQCTDDCIDQPSCNIGVKYDDGATPPVDFCGNTLVTVTSSDWCVPEWGWGWACVYDSYLH